MSTVYRARVVRIDSEGVFAEVPELGEDGEWGPLELLAIPQDLVVGDECVVATINDIPEDLVLLGAAVATVTPSPDPAPDLSAYLHVVSGVVAVPDDVKIAVGVVSPTATFETALDSATSPFLKVAQDGDSQPRYWVDGNGKTFWGSGSGATDASLERKTNGMRLDPRLGINADPVSGYRLKITTPGGSDSALSILNSTADPTNALIDTEAFSDNVRVFTAKVTGDTNPRFDTYSDGQMEWGPGNTANDVSMARDATVAGIRIVPKLGVNGAPGSNAGVVVRQSTSTGGYLSTNSDTGAHVNGHYTASEAGTDASRVFQAFRSGEAQPTFYTTLGGDLRWGPGISATVDTTLSRTGIAELTINEYLFVDNAIYAGPDAGDLGRGLVVSTSFVTSGAAIGTTETVCLTTASAIFRADRAFRIIFEGKGSTSVSGVNPAISFRKTNVSGTILANMGRTGGGISGSVILVGSAVFKVVSSNVTAQIAMTLAAATGTITHVGASDNPRMVSIYDIGPASDYPNAPVLS